MTSELEIPKNTQVNSEMREKFSNETVLSLMKKLQEIEKLAIQAQGRWANVDTNSTPNSVLPFKDIIQIITSNN